MADISSVYHKWLGIPPKDQPPNHYRLLGVELFESDPDVIDNACDQRLSHVRRFQTGANSALSQTILNEIAAARICLLNPAKKAAYDAELRQTLAPPAADAISPPSPPASAQIQQPIPIGQPAMPPATHTSAPVGFPREEGASRRDAATVPLTASRRSTAPRSRKRGPAATIAGIVLGGIGGVALAYVALCLISPQNDFLNIWPDGQIAQSPSPPSQREPISQPAEPKTAPPSIEQVAPDTRA